MGTSLVGLVVNLPPSDTIEFVWYWDGRRNADYHGNPSYLGNRGKLVEPGIYYLIGRFGERPEVVTDTVMITLQD